MKRRKQSVTLDICLSPREFMRNGRKYTRVITHDMVRDILVPEKKMPAIAEVLVLSQNELMKIISDSQKDPEHLRQKQIEENEKKAAASEKRRREMLERCKKNVTVDPKLTELEMRSKAKAKFMLARALEMHREQEDEIKLCNGLILSMKCQAIRDAQIAEKKLIETEHLQKNKQIEKMVEGERQQDMERMEAEKTKKLLKKNEFIKELKCQLHYNRKQQEIASEIMKAEFQLANEAAKQARAEEEQRTHEKIKKQQEMKLEMIRVNSEMKRAAEEERKKMSLIDLKIQECLRAKAELELKKEEEIQKAKRQCERDASKFRKGFEKQLLNNAFKEKIMVMKIQDEVEKKWRAQEREAAMKRACLISSVRFEREKQIEEKRRSQAAEVEKRKMEREEMENMDSAFKIKEKEEKEKQRCELKNYRKDLLKQMAEKEEERLCIRKRNYEDRVAQGTKERERQQELKMLMKKKIDEMRTHNIPEKYIKEIETKLRIA